MGFSVENSVAQNSVKNVKIGSNPAYGNYYYTNSLSQKPDSVEFSTKQEASTKEKLLGALSRFSFGQKATTDDISKYGLILDQQGVDAFLEKALTEESIQAAVQKNPKIKQIILHSLNRDIIAYSSLGTEGYAKMLLDASGRPVINTSNFSDIKGNHLEPATDYAVGVARNLNLSNSEIEALKKGMMLHDIGKVFIPTQILDYKNQPLPAEYRSVINLHSRLGYELLKTYGVSENVADIARHHHTDLKYNPSQLAKIARVADAYSALTETTRSYHAGHSPQRAMRILEGMENGNHIDQEVLNALKTLLGTYDENHVVA